MNTLYAKTKTATLLLSLVMLCNLLRAQCPNLFDFYGNVVDNPYWYSCSGNDYALNISSPNTWGEYTIDWGDGSPLTTGMSWAPPTFISHTYAAAVDTFIVVITEVNSGCETTGVLIMEEASSASIQIPVGGLTQACAPQVMEFINSSTNVSETTVFTWDFGDGTAPLVFDYTNWNQTISHLYDVGTVTCETEVTLTAENYCNIVQGGFSTATFNPIRIWDLDDPSITASATLLCYPDTTVTFLNTTYRNCLFQGNIYQRYEWWNFGDYWGLGYDSIIDWTPWPPTFPHTMHYPGIGTYTVELLDSNFCGIAPTSITIQIVPPPVADIEPSVDTVCVGEPITFYQLASGGANSYQWNMGTGGPWINTGSGNITFIFQNPGTYTVSSMVGISGASSACNDVDQCVVVVLPAPDVQIIADQTDGCDDFMVDFDGFATDATTWQWQFDVPPLNFSGQDPPLVNFNTPGDHLVTLNVIGFNGCAASDDEVIHVYESPQVNFSVLNLCEGDTAQFIDMSTASSNDNIIGWNWDFGDGQTSTDQNPFHYYTTPGTYDVALLVNSVHCFNADTMTVTVEDAPQAEITLDVSTGCSPLTVQFDNTTVNAATHLWDFGDGFGATDYITSHTFINPLDHDTTYMVTMTALNAFGCGTIDTLHVTPMPSAIAAFDGTNNPPGCSPFAADFINNSQNADTYLWDFGDGMTSNLFEPNYTYINTTGLLVTYTVELIAYNNNGCNDTISQPLIIYPLADFDFAIAGSEGCAPHTVTMPFVNGAQIFSWDFGDGQTSSFANPTHLFENNTASSIDYTVTLTAASAFGCTDTASTTVTVHPQPTAQFILSSTSGCGPLAVQINCQSIGATSYLWNYGDGSTDTIMDTLHTHVFTNTSDQVLTRTITLQVSNVYGCTSTYLQTVQIYPEVIAGFVPPAVYCSPVTTQFFNTSINANNYSWDFGNGLQSIVQNPTTTYTNISGAAINYNVALIAQNSYGCSDTTSQSLTVNPTPVAGFSLDALAGCSPLVVNISNTSVNADTISWEYGDGNTSNSPDSLHTHTYYNYGTVAQTFTVVLTTTSTEGCTSQFTNIITVYPGVTAAFGDPGEHCSPANISFVNNSINASAFQWDFGNGTNSVIADPTAYFTNTGSDPLIYDVMLLAVSGYGCTDTAHHDLTINHTPVATFMVDVMSGCSPLNVQFTNSSQNADQYNWIYGDGATSNIADTTHQHIFVNTTGDAQTFNVMMTASTTEGCSSTATQIIQVFPEITAAFTPPAEYCSPASISFTNNSVGGISYFWDFGNGTTSLVEDPSGYFSTSADTTEVYNVQLMVSSSFGCNVTVSHPLTLHPAPVADFDMDENAACFPAAVVFTNNSTVATEFAWNYGDGNLSTISDSIHTHQFDTPINNTSQYDVVLTAATAHGCVATHTETFTLYPAVDVQFAVDTIGCSPFNAFFVNQSQGAASYVWAFGDAQVSSLTSPTHTYVTDLENDTTYTAQLLGTSIYGCADTAAVNIHVMHTPEAIAQMDSVFGCYPTNVTFFNGSIGADSYQWTYGTGETSTTSAPYHDYAYYNITSNVVTYNITLNAYTNYGCSSSDNLSIEIAPEIEAAFYVQAEGCSPLEVYFDNQSTGGNGYQWNFGDGDFSTDYEPQHTFFNWGNSDTTYAITFVLEDSFGCTDTATQYVYVYAIPQASFTATPQTQVWPNSTITLDNTTIGGTLQNTWDMDDGTEIYLAEPGTYVYSTWGEYSIQLVVDNGSCSDTTYQNIEIIPPSPVADFTGPAQGCAPLTVQFTNLSEYAMQSDWQFGDGGEANATNPIYTYWQAGIYTVTLTVTGPDGSTDQMVQEQIIEVYPNAHAAFTVIPNEVSAPSQPIYALNQSQNANIYFWDFGDGSTSVASNPVYYYQEEGDYTVTLIANNEYNCPDTLTLPNVVHVIAEGNIAFPNAFSPSTNEEGTGYYDALSYDNDIFFPMHKGIDEYQLQIFNKWGELLFESKDVYKGWNGYYAGELCKQDVYVWKVSATFVNGQTYEKSGDVTLIVK
ncbi:MAG: PKD domain-containing protein [Flavobacteriales bacterium]